MTASPDPESPPTRTYNAPPSWPAWLPTSLNAEALVALAAWLLVAVVTLASGTVGAAGFVAATVALTVGYLLSRGIAKAGKVGEDEGWPRR